MAEAYVIQQVAKKAGDFVVKKRGTWNHEEWEQFCAAFAAQGLEMDGDRRTQLGLLLEALKALYVALPKKPKAKTPVKRKARAKSKVKAKPRAKKADVPPAPAP
jgi:hypothetical protein